VTDLVNLSQVLLCLVLPLALFPLMYFTSRSDLMGKYKAGRVLIGLGWVSTVLITCMALYSLPESLRVAWQIIQGN